jgi:signal transduction histidine kinase
MAANVIAIPSRSDAHRSALAARRAGILDERRRAFLRMASHELRTPLNSVIGFSEILANERCGPLGSPQYKLYAEHVRVSGHKLLRLINQMLEIFRLDGDLCDFRPICEPAANAIDDAVDALQAVLREKNLTVSVASDAPSPSVRADAAGLRTVLGNLLQNAIAVSPVGGEIRVRCAQRGDRVEIAIADDGQGVKPGEIPRLMRPFEQGEDAIARSNEGCGLGLPIARLLCRNMNGSLRLTCLPGRGLEAIVALPAEEAPG